MLDTLRELLAVPWIRAATIAGGSVVGAFIARFIIEKTVLALTRKTKTDLDDLIVENLRRPVLVSLVLVGLAWAVSVLAKVPPGGGWHLTHAAARVLYRVMQTFAVLVWLLAAMRLGKLVLAHLARRGEGEHTGIVRQRTRPVFDIVLKVALVASALYLWLSTWGVNLSGWLASAGILGIVMGLAAKDTVANLFAGIFILADAPYKLGDFIQLDEAGLRGKVTDIGIRSTRILTRDDIQITIPNAIMGSAKIVNETGGPFEKVRVHATVEAAYGSDVDLVTEVLDNCWQGTQYICETPRPEVRFRKFGASGLVFQLLVYTERPELRGPVVSTLNMRIYKDFAKAGIEIPYSKHDVYIKEMPSGATAPAAADSEQQAA